MKIQPIFRLGMLLLFLVSCTSRQETLSEQFDNLNNYQEYIAEVSHGMISVKSDVRVIFNQPIELWNNGDQLDGGLLKVSPNIKGKVVALDNRTIAFVPEGGFKQDTEYQFVLSLKDIVNNVPTELKTLTFGVKTLKQQFSVYTDALQSYSKERQFINGQIRTSDVLSLEIAKQLVVAQHKGTTINLKFDSAVTEGTQFQFKIDSIQRFEEDSELELTWDGTRFDIDNTGRNTIKIAGKNNFTVLDASVETANDQVVLINFSDPIKKGQNFKGLVVLEGSSNPKYAVDGNTLKVYPSENLKGTANLEVFEGIQSEDGYKLKSKFEQRVAFEQLQPQIRLLSNGTILPSSNNLKVNFEAVNLNAVDVAVFKIYQNNILQFLQGNNINGNYNLRSVARPIATKKLILQNNLANVDANGKWAAHALDLSALITPEVGAMYRVEFDYRPSYSTYKCDATNFDAEVETDENFDQEEENSSWDGVEEYYDEFYYYDYDWNERENPCDKSYYYDKKIGMNLLATDLGVTIKKGVNKSYFIAVNDL
ncbi:MAG: Ig-like domain-containing protein, partial [Flavobacteriaceae bacterium]